MAFKQTQTEMMNSGVKIAPDEIDQNLEYTIINPDIGTARIGTANITGDVNGTLVIGQPFLDAPRTLMFSIGGVAGGIGGTAIVTGKDQFGNAIQESMGFATAATVGSAVGTKIFSKVSTATAILATTGGTGVGTCFLGYPLGDAVMTIGLPAKIGAAADLKRVIWHDAGVSKALTVGTGGTIGTAVAGTAMSSVTLTGLGGFATADSYKFVYRSSFQSEASVFSD